MVTSQELTLQQLKPLVVNPTWAHFESYLSDERDKLLIQLTQCNTEDFKKLQGQVQALDKLLRLKDHMTNNQ